MNELNQATFNQWMQAFVDKATNDLRFSNTRFPKRMEKITLDLSVAPTQPVKINVPFKSVQVSRIFSTATPTLTRSGKISVMFDYDNTMNQANAIDMYQDDNLVLEHESSIAFLTWTAQTDTSITLYFYVDIDMEPALKRAITSFEAPSSAIGIEVNSVGTATYTIPAGYKARATFDMDTNSVLAADINAKVDTFTVMHLTAAANTQKTKTSTFVQLKAGQVILLTNTAGTATALNNACYIELYPI
jgi:hypothetical protein